ncbi:MAG: SAM-dependent methyltransferase [Trebonia sp.]
MTDEGAPPGFDITRPNVPRVYNFMIGGKDHFAADRAAADAILRVEPNAAAEGRAHRDFLGRVVRYMAGEAGISQFIDVGSGIPGAENTHHIAQRIDPAARVVYVDNDPVVITHARALIGETATTRVIAGDAREPKAMLDDPLLREFIDFARPVGVLLMSILHHLTDEEGPDVITRTFRNALAPGSHLALSHFCDPGAANPKESGIALESERVFTRNFGTGRWRTTGEITAFFGDFRLISPGLVPLALWWPDKPWAGEVPGFFHRFVGGVAVKERAAVHADAATGERRPGRAESFLASW